MERMERCIQRANKPLRLDQRKQCKRASPRILRPSVSRTSPLEYPGDLHPDTQIPRHPSGCRMAGMVGPGWQGHTEKETKRGGRGI